MVYMASVSEFKFTPFFIISRDHFFDTFERRRTKQKKTKSSTISKPTETARGSRPVRAYHACNEEKILPTTRLGIAMDN